MQHSSKCCPRKPHGTCQIESRSVMNHLPSASQREPPRSTILQSQAPPNECAAPLPRRACSAHRDSPSGPPQAQGTPSTASFIHNRKPAQDSENAQDNLPVPYKTGEGLYWSDTVAWPSSRSRGTEPTPSVTETGDIAFLTKGQAISSRLGCTITTSHSRETYAHMDRLYNYLLQINCRFTFLKNGSCFYM